MRRSPGTDRIAAQPLCLGLVIVPAPGKLAEAADAVKGLGEIELGEPQRRGLPASVFTTVGEDRELIGRIEELSSVLSVEVAFAQALGEEADR